MLTIYYFYSEEGSMISLIVPNNGDILEICKMLDTEIERASVIKESTRRVHFLDAIRNVRRILGHYQTSKNKVTTSEETTKSKSHFKSAIQWYCYILRNFKQQH